MLWTSLRWNWGNTLVFAAFCLLALLSAVNNAFVFYDRDGASRGDALVCSWLCETNQQSLISAPRADVAPATMALLEPQASVD